MFLFWIRIALLNAVACMSSGENLSLSRHPKKNPELCEEHPGRCFIVSYAALLARDFDGLKASISLTRTITAAIAPM